MHQLNTDAHGEVNVAQRIAIAYDTRDASYGVIPNLDDGMGIETFGTIGTD